jgi:hypothetical protein
MDSVCIHALSLNDNSKIINVVKRQRNLGLVQYVLAAIEKTEKIIVLRSTSNKNTVVYWLASSLLHYNSNIYRWGTQNVCVQIVRSSKVNKCRDIKKGLKMSKGKTDVAARNQNGADNTMTKRKRDKGKKQYMYIKHHTDNKD